MRGNLNKAMDYFVKALQIKHDYPEAHVNWGLALMQKGNLDEAITHFREALKIKPDFKEAGDNLRVALAQQKMRR
jgi:tetratricopeptide (TPR) repeat protein